MNSAENFVAPSAAPKTADGEAVAVRPTAAAPGKRGSIRALRHMARRAAGASGHRRSLCR